MSDPTREVWMESESYPGCDVLIGKQSLRCSGCKMILVEYAEIKIRVQYPLMTFEIALEDHLKKCPGISN